jgi:hypothetical protein
MLNVIMGVLSHNQSQYSSYVGDAIGVPHIWTQTEFFKYKVDEDNNKICPRCDTINGLSSLPILSNESFTFDYSIKRGIVLQLKRETSYTDSDI